MTASLTIVNPYTNTAGTAVLFPVSTLVTYPVIPTSGITGFTVTVNGSSNAITAATSNADGLVTLTVATPIISSDTVTLSYTPGNLTDSTATPNTLPSFTNTAVQNLAGQTSLDVAISNANIFYYADTVSTLTYVGHAVTYINSTDAYLTFKFTGTGLGIQASIQDATIDFAYSIDGGAFVTPTVSTNRIPKQLIVSGLTDTQHTIQISQIGAGIRWDTAAAFTIYGSSPAVAPFVDPGQVYKVSTLGSSLLADGNFTRTLNSGWNVAQASTSYQQVLRFRATCTRIDVFSYHSLSFALSIDRGTPGAVVTTPATFPGFWGWSTLATGLDGSTEHEYTLITTSFPTYVQAFRVQSGETINTSITYPNRDMWGFYGDSITAGIGLGGNYALGFASLLGLSRDVAVFNSGVSGSTVKQFGSGSAPVTTQAGQARTTAITGVTPTIKKLFILYGTNDMGQAGGTETASDLQTAYTSMLTTIQGALPTIPIYVTGILPRLGYTAATVLTWNTATQNAIAAAPTPANITYLDSATWQLNGASGTDYTTNYFDGLHPNAAGNLIMKNEMGASIANPPLYTSSYISSNRLTVVVFTQNGTTPLLPASAATGFTVKLGGVTQTISSAACTSNYIVIMMSTAIGAGTVTVEYTGGNVTDNIGTPMTAFTAQTTTPLTALSAGSASLTDAKSITVSAASSGLTPYTYQWYRSNTSGFTPGGGNIISGATARNYIFTDEAKATTYYYKNIVTDSEVQSITTAVSNELQITTTAVGGGGGGGGSGSLSIGNGINNG